MWAENFEKRHASSHLFVQLTEIQRLAFFWREELWERNGPTTSSIGGSDDGGDHLRDRQGEWREWHGADRIATCFEL